MSSARSRFLLVALLLAVAGAIWLAAGEPGAGRDWNQRKLRFEQAAQRAEPLLTAITRYTDDTGHPPSRLAELSPDYLATPPSTGIEGCARFEYRSLASKQGAIAWYDLGSRQGQPWSGQSRYHDGDPDHAILVFTLDAQDKVTGALIERMPKGHKPQPFDPERWKAGGQRLDMALALPDTYRLNGMPKAVLVSLLGAPDGSRTVRGSPWELRINCPTGLFNHDVFLYWPTQSYPPRLYGGTTEVLGRWAYVHS